MGWISSELNYINQKSDERSKFIQTYRNLVLGQRRPSHRKDNLLREKRIRRGCQNLYLGCTAIDAGTCAIASYDQDKTDKFILKVAKARREIEIYKPTTVEPPLPPSEEEIREFEQFKASFRKQISALLEEKKINKKQLEEFIWELHEEFCE